MIYLKKFWCWWDGHLWRTIRRGRDNKHVKCLRCGTKTIFATHEALTKMLREAYSAENIETALANPNAARKVLHD